MAQSPPFLVRFLTHFVVLGEVNLARTNHPHGVDVGFLRAKNVGYSVSSTVQAFFMIKAPSCKSMVTLVFS